MYRSFFLSFLVIIPYLASSQNVEKMLRDAEKIFYEEDFAAARLKFEEILEIEPEESKAKYHYLICHFLTDGRGAPMDELLELYGEHGRLDKFYNYWLGRIYFGNYDAQLAIRHFQLFLDSRATKSKEIVDETKRFFDDAKWLLGYLRNPDDYEIRLVQGVNSEQNDLSPVFFKDNDELLFLSSRFQPGNETDYHVFHSKYKADGWEKPSEIPVLGSFEFWNANLEVVNEDGKLFVFNRKRGGRLFYSEQSTGEWIAPVEFDSHLSGVHVQSHFYINPKEDWIIFASNHGKSAKDFDLYQSRLDKTTGDWSEATPLAGDISSVFDELSPYLSSDEKSLYFSSNRKGFVGGFDVFVSTFDENTQTWSTPENMGFPINSPDNELNFKMNPNMEEGYFSSDRIHGMGGFDIYYFWEIEKVNIEGVITGADGQPLVNHQIKFHPSSYYDESFTSFTDANGKYGNEIISDEVFIVEIFDQDYKMVFDNSIQIKASGGLATTLKQNFVVGRERSEDFLFLSNLEEDRHDDPVADYVISKGKDTMIEEGSQVLSATQQVESEQAATSRKYPSVIRKLVRPNVYFENTRTYFSPDYQKLLDEVLSLLRENEGLVIEIAGHTDNFGSQKINLVISQKRAELVRTHLINKGIAANRIVARGYGDSRPMASNDQEIEGRELNRRVEFLVLAEGK